ncbi:MAG TPA: hypothetical protein VGI13_01845 [Candidatus Acidoferrum sp.]|jgi:hypothetical protein
MATPQSEHTVAHNVVELPAPTAWPFILAVGFTLLCAGLLTNVSVSVLGAVLTIAGCAGWFREVFPHEHEIAEPIIPEDLSIATDRGVVERLPIAPEQSRAWLPIETYPISAGLKGGLAGSVAMAVLACTYGLVSVGSIWYPINLLAGVVYAPSELPSLAYLKEFHLITFIIAVILHLTGSVLVGLLYGAMLPMFARRPILLGGLIVPVLWSGLLYSTMDLLNPLLGKYIHWGWFVASQIAFGVVAGLVAIRQSRVPTSENLPFAMRAGIEAPGAMATRGDGEKRP